MNPGLGELLRHLTELVDRGAEANYRRQGLAYRPRYTPIMRALARGEHSVRELTERLAITQGAVSQSVKRMEAEEHKGTVKVDVEVKEDKALIRLSGQARKYMFELCGSDKVEKIIINDEDTGEIEDRQGIKITSIQIK